MREFLLLVSCLVVIVHGGPQGLAPNVRAKIDSTPFLLKVSASTLKQLFQKAGLFKTTKNNTNEMVNLSESVVIKNGC